MCFPHICCLAGCDFICNSLGFEVTYIAEIFHLILASKLLHLALAGHELVLVIVVQSSRTAITSKAMNCCIVKTIHYPITITIL
jgi:hypothetical protein